MADRDIDVEEFMPLRKRLSLRPEIEPQQQQEVEALPENFKNKIIEMRGTEERLIFNKTLTKTDIDKGESRLSIPLSKLLSHSFLTFDEKKTLEQRLKGNMKGSLNVKVIDPSLEVWELKFRKYDTEKTKKGKKVKKSPLYALGYYWNHVVKANSLRQGDHLQLWSFRSQQKLCFALVLLQGQGKLLGN